MELKIHPTRLPLIPDFERSQFSNGLTVRVLPDLSQELIKMVLTVKAGSIHSANKVAAEFSALVIEKGSTTRSANLIAQELDYYGVVFNQAVTQTFFRFSIQCLRKHFRDVLPIVADFILHPTYPESEVKLYAEQSKVNYRVSRMRPGRVVLDAMTSDYFAENSPFGRVTKEEDYDSINVQDIRDYQAKVFRPDISILSLGGCLGAEELKYIEHYFGENSWERPAEPFDNKIDVALRPVSQRYRHIDMPDAQQASVMFCLPMIEQGDKDYPAMYVTDYILGGGTLSSRLMSNIREKKGLTYGIQSYINGNCYWSRHNIVSEVNRDKVGVVIDEVSNEIRRMQEELVPEDELAMSLATLKGSFLSDFDGTLSCFDSMIPMMDGFGLTEEDIRRRHAVLETITSEDIMRCAQSYYNVDGYRIISAG
ncbi:MAG: insulinase family protein [Marinilabiliaceae bacterium]|nr:insulinase family protein [Marinilabiliaceae bacterium]